MTRNYTNTVRKTLALLTAVLMITSVVAPAAGHSLSASTASTTVDPGVETSDDGLEAQSSHATNVTSCRDISTEGLYEIGRDIAVSTDSTCINIQASNVTLDGNGYKIWHDDFGDLSAYSAIEATDVSNVTVQNVSIRYFNDAVELYNVTNSTVVDVISDIGFEFPTQQPDASLSANGIVLESGSENNTVRSNELYSVATRNDFDSAGNGIYVTDSNNNTIADNVVSIPGNVGVRLENASDNNVSANEVSAGGVVREPGLAHGIIVAADSDRNLVADNLLRGNSLSEQNGQTGITVTRLGVGPPAEYAPSDHNRIVDNDVKNFAFDGIAAFDNNATTLVDNDVDGSNEYGIRVSGVESANLTNNVVDFSGYTGGEANILVSATDLTLVENEADSGYGDGFEIRDVRSATILNNTASNDGADLRLVNTTTLSVENLDLLNYVVSFDGRNVSMALNDSASSFGVEAPAPYQAVHHFDAGKTYPDGFADATITYNEGKVRNDLGLNESTLSLWNRSGTWNEVPEAELDTAADTIAVNLTAETNLTSKSLYAIAGIDDIKPTITAYNVTTSGVDLTMSFTASEKLAGVLVEIRNGSGFQQALELSDFTVVRDIQTNTFDYSATTSLSSGSYTVVLRNASDDAGNNGSSGQTLSATPRELLSIDDISVIDPDDDGRVGDGEAVTISADVSGANLTVTANASELGGPSSLTLTENADGSYTGVFTASLPLDASGTANVDVTARDGENRTTATSNTLALDSVLKVVGLPSITDATDGDGNVTDGHEIHVSVDVEGTNVTSVAANASDFGGPDRVPMTDDNNNGTYVGTFTVGTDTALRPKVAVTLTDNESRTVTETSFSSISVDVSAPVLSTLGDSLNVSRVQDGDVVNIKVYTFDDLALDRVVANASAFGGPDTLTLQKVSLDNYAGTFSVDGANARSDGTYDIPVTAVDTFGQSATVNLSLEMNNTGNDDPPVLTNPTATNLDGFNTDVRSGHRIDVSVEALDVDGGVDTIYANASDFGVDRVALTEASPGIYNGTFTIDPDNASANGDYDIEIVATDGFGNTATTSTGNLALNLDTTAPLIISATPTISATAANDGTVLETEVEVLEQGSGVTSVKMDLSALGAGTVTLTETSTQDVYNATYTVDAARAGPDGKYFPDVTVTDSTGNTATQPSSVGITLDTEPPVFNNVTATSLNGSSDVARDGDVIRVRANVTDNTTVPGQVFADGSAFGAEEEILLEFSDVDVYTATFTVNGSEANPDDVYPVPLTAIDGPGNVANATTDLIELNTTGDGETDDTTPPGITDVRAIDRADGDGVVSGGDLIEVRAFVSDFDSGVQEVLAFPEAFGVEDVVLTNEEGDLYNATFRVGGNETTPDDSYPITITAVDGAGNAGNATTSLLELNTSGDREPDNETPPTVGGFDNAPTDPDGDGFHEDINGNGEVNVVDVQAMFANRDDSALKNNPQLFDFSDNGEVDIVDVQALFAEITEE